MLQFHTVTSAASWADLVPGLKSVDDAAAIRERLLLAFEYAESEPDPAERARLLTVVIVGAGPKGVDMADTISALVTRTLAADLYSIGRDEVRVLLVECGARLLPALRKEIAESTRTRLEAAGVEIRLETHVTAIASDHVIAGGARIETRTAVWADGAQPCPVPLGAPAPPPRPGLVRRWLSTHAPGKWARPVGAAALGC